MMVRNFAGLFCFALLNISLVAQNLVPNSDFELYNPCPLAPGEFNNCTSWNNPTGATPDYLNVCSWQIGGVSVPNNILGMQNARSGNGYAGLIAYEDGGIIGCPNTLFSSEWREYLHAQLTSPMQAGQSYCVEFFVSLGDNVRYGIEDLGMYISTTPINDPDSVALPYTPQVVNTNGPITDITNWVQITGTFVASGGEQYICIGNFQDDNSTNVVCANQNALNPYAYYYVEDVYIAPLNQCCTMLLNGSSNDETCVGNDGTASVTPNGGAGPFQYNWINGGTTQTISGLAAGNYVVTVTDANSCVASVSVTVNNNGGLNINPTSADATCGACDGTATANQIGGTPPFTYLWDANASNQNTQTATALCGGTYNVTVSDNVGCTATVTVAVGGGGASFTLNSNISDADCNTACDGAVSLTPVGGTAPFTYTWDANAGSQSTPTASNLCAGTYSVTVDDNSSGGGTTVFWSEDFGTGCTRGLLVNAYSGSNGAWAIAITGTTQPEANKWYVSATEAGMGAGNCGNRCLNNATLTNRTLHVGADDGLTTTDPGALYNTGGLCSPFPFACVLTDLTAQSPNINCAGQTGIALSFNYMEGGAGLQDNASVFYSINGGSTWNLLIDLPKTVNGSCSGGTGLWTAFTTPLPVANNIPNFKIGFRWVNNDDASGTDPSFAVDDIELSSSSGSGGCPLISSFTVAEPTPVTSSIFSNDANCGQNDGTASVTPSGGTPTYSYSWSTGSNNAFVTGLAQGNYSVTVSDQNGCQDIQNVSIGGGVASGPPGVWTWTGIVDTSWFEPCNWDKITVPNNTSIVHIPGGTLNNPWIETDTAYCREITIMQSNGGHLFNHVATGGKLIKTP